MSGIPGSICPTMYSTDPPGDKNRYSGLSADRLSVQNLGMKRLNRCTRSLSAKIMVAETVVAPSCFEEGCTPIKCCAGLLTLGQNSGNVSPTYLRAILTDWTLPLLSKNLPAFQAELCQSLR